MTSLELEWLPGELVVSRLPADRELPFDFPWRAPLTAVVRTGQELSVVAPALVRVPGAREEGPWRAFRVVGALDFGLTGILASLAVPLAKAGVSIFAVSTFDTDYMLVREEAVEATTRVLGEKGFRWAGEVRGDT
jgi:hypothetical protein